MNRRRRELTPVQGKILHMLREQAKPLSAYDLLHRLRADGATAPPTVYRALDKLIGEGLVHRIETLSAFVACGGKPHADSPAFLICEDCGQVSERPAAAIGLALEEAYREAGFQPRRAAIEATGRCAGCAEGRSEAA